MSGDLRQLDAVVNDFLAEIGKAADARILRDLRRMAADGHRFKGNTRPLGGGLLELKVAHAGMAYRLVYVHHNRCAVFLICFEKKTQKTPSHILRLAKQRYASLVRQEVDLGEIELN
jgi:phage-related protein